LLKRFWGYEIDPITAFALCKGAYEGIKGCVAVYQDLKKTGSDLSNITGEVGGALSGFFKGQAELEAGHKKTEVQREENKRKGIKDDLASQAIDNVMYLRQTKQFYADLERMVRWEMGQPDLWREFVDEYQRLLDQKAEDNARELHKKRVAEWRRQKLKNKILDRALETGLVLFVAAYLIILMWMISLHHKGRLATFLS
jgi:hypothetical protein